MTSFLKQDSRNYEEKISRYSLLIFAIAILNFYGLLNIIKATFNNEAEGTKYSLVTLLWISIWDGYFCMVHFFFAVNTDDIFSNFIVPSFAYFFIFSLFETRLVVMIWKAHYFPGSEMTQDQIRSKLVKFYTRFYILLIASWIIIYNFFLNNVFLVIVNFFLLPQILLQAKNGQYFQMNKQYIYGLLLPRSLFILYMRGCPENLF